MVETMSILFINGSPEKEGNTARLARALLAGHDYVTYELADHKIYDYGQHFADDESTSCWRSSGRPTPSSSARRSTGMT